MSECLKHVQTDVILCYTVLDPDLFAEYSIKRERETEKLCYIYAFREIQIVILYLCIAYICVCMYIRIPIFPSSIGR